MALLRLGTVALVLVLVALTIQATASAGLRRLAPDSSVANDEDVLAPSSTTPPSLQPPFCYMERNFDYENHDIGNKSPLMAWQCCGECHSKAGCKAWSWSNHNGGTCWFKSKRGAFVYKPGVMSSFNFNTRQDVCKIESNTNYGGYDIGRGNSTTAFGCCERCKNYPNCRAFSWTNQYGGTCWFKSQKGTPNTTPGAYAAEVYPDPPRDEGPVLCDVKMEYNVDYYGNDIGNVRSNSAWNCCAICRDWTSGGTCRAYSWSNYNGGTCWLKSYKGSVNNTPGVMSAVLWANPDDCTIEPGVDYYDNDIGNAPSRTAAGCCEICKGWNGGNGVCKAFSWNAYNSGTCWLKSRMGSTVVNSAVMSGTVS